jgi:hypothetical protein
MQYLSRLKGSVTSWSPPTSPLLPEEYRAPIPTALLQARRTFITGCAFGLSRDLYAIATNVSSMPVPISLAFVDSLFAGVELSLLPLVSSLAYSKFAPKLDNFPKIAAWSLSGGLASAIAMSLAEGLVTTQILKESTVPHWLRTQFGPGVSGGCAFQGVYLIGQTYLPPFGRYGQFARTATAVVGADFARAIASAPFRKSPKEPLTLGGVFRVCRSSMPLALFDTAAYSMIDGRIGRFLPG